MNDNVNSQIGFFAQISNTITNPFVKDWKEKDGAVVGYFCPVLPEELLMAAGFFPFLMRGTGSDNTNQADEYFRSSSNCSFPRHCFNLALEGKYGFLDGVVMGTTCDTLKNVMKNWSISPIGTPFVYMVNTPHVSGEVMAEYYRGELAKFRAALEEHFKVEITDEKLGAAIKTCNETRELQRQLYALRKLENPPLSGSDIVSVMVAGTSMPKELYNAKLKQLLADIGETEIGGKKKLRLMLVGSCGDDTLFTQIVEELGAVVVADETCFGGKVIHGKVDEENKDPLDALARYQIVDNPICAKMANMRDARREAVLSAVSEYQVDGVLGQRLGCCDTWGVELYILHEQLLAAGIPSMMLEREYVPDNIGQVSTRVQAFLETMGG